MIDQKVDVKPGSRYPSIMMVKENAKSVLPYVFPFEMFITKLKESYESLKDNGIPTPERVKVMNMCEKINSSNTKVQQAVTNVQLGANPYRPANSTMKISPRLVMQSLRQLVLSFQQRKLEPIATETLAVFVGTEKAVEVDAAAVAAMDVVDAVVATEEINASAMELMSLT